MLIRDNETGKIHEYGTNRHDALRISEDGKCLYYENLQNGDGSFGGGYSIVMEDGKTPEHSETADARECMCYADIGGFEKTLSQQKTPMAETTNSSLYKKFRSEIAEMVAEDILQTSIVKEVMFEGKRAGILIIEGGYIEAAYVLPEYRRKGLMRQAVLDYIREYDMPEKLHIIKKNTAAQKFWESIFRMELIDEDEIEGLYEIKGRIRIQDVISKKDYNYVSYRVTMPEGSTEKDTFCGCFKSENGKIIPLDGDSYDDDEEVLSFEEWSMPEKGIKNGLTVVVEGCWEGL